MRTTLLALSVASVASSLAAQAMTWTSFQDRRSHTLARTPSGGVVMFGGERATNPGQALADSYRLSSSNQNWAKGTSCPDPLKGHGMVGVGGSPGTSSKYVVFGGIGRNGQPSAKTWDYDGSSWDVRGQGTQQPLARSAHGMVAGDLGGPFSNNPRIWMFGGFSGSSELQDLWSYQPDVDQWNLLGPQPGQPAGSWPTARSFHAMAFYQGSGAGGERVYLFGGRTSGQAYANDLWRFDPNNNSWQLLTPANPPSPRRETAMAYVPGQGGIVLFGGVGTLGALGDTWVYDPVANAWAQRTPATAPPARFGHAVAIDVQGDKLVMLGGLDASAGPAAGSWIWNSQPPGTWTEQSPLPSSRSGVAIAFDRNTTRQRHVMFGGVSAGSGSVLDETWELTGVDWARRTPSARPSARTDAGMVYDGTRDRVVLYGGRNQSGVGLGDTWEWNGASWTLSALQGVPPAAGGVGMAYDSARGQTVMSVAGATAQETWRLSGSAWTQIQTPVSPPSRTNFGMAYDSRRDQIVMFGGMTSNARASSTYNNETWIFDGTTWVRRFPDASPSPRGWCKIVYDEARSRMVLHGGADASNAFEDTWEWDGTRWIEELPQAIPSNPSAYFAHGMSYDASRSVTVAHGRIGTWEYSPVAPADVTSYGAGCPTSAGGTLSIKQLAWSRLWLGDRLELEFEYAPALSLGLMLWGLSDTSFGAGVPLPLDLRLLGFSTGACYLRTAADVATEAIFPGTTRYVSFPMPLDPFLVGLHLYLQAAYFDAPANPANAPVVTSNGLRMQLGQKAPLPQSPLPIEPNPALNMVRIGAGTFQMGSVAVGGTAVPVHPVQITSPFWVGRYEVTQAQYQAVMGENPAINQGPQKPVTGASWSFAMRYCALLTEAERLAGRVPPGYQYRLPTEAEWEYCCRAGTQTEWSTGSTLSCSQANLAGCGTGGISNVGSYPANAFGLHDMHGNVHELCLDAWDLGANYPSGPVTNPIQTSGWERVIRGGSFSDANTTAQSARRNSAGWSFRGNNIGFRIVLGPEIAPEPPVALGMLRIGAGSFQMGSAVVAGNALPVHPVQISRPFWIGRHELTQTQYQSVMAANPSQYQAPANPVERVSWNSAVAYCAALTSQEAALGRVPAGYQYRLPTEAEWEYVCRAGTTTDWNVGNSIACGQANFGTCIGQPQPVGSYAPNAWGVYDMHANIQEWCLDNWDGSANYPSTAVTDPVVRSGANRVLRSGSWIDSPLLGRSAHRNSTVPTSVGSQIGFRIVLAPILP